MPTDPFAAIFSPERIALVGASERAGGMGEVFWRNLESFPGEVVPVTPKAEQVFGRPAYASLRDVPDPVDLAVVVVAAAAVPEVVRDAGAAGVPAVVVISGGFAETGRQGARLQDELLVAARESGVRIVGPNCLGLQNCDLPMNASMAQGPSAGGGGITLVTQSGAYGMAIHSVGRDEGTRFAKVYAAGNKVDIGDAELLAWLGADPASRTVCFFSESITDGRSFAETAAAVTPHKPVVVARTGRSTAGSRAAVSHTAALAGDERVSGSVLAGAGVVLARTGLEMMDVARALDSQPVPAGPRVAVVTNSGGTGVELTDLLADEGLEVPELSAGLRAELDQVLPAYGSSANPVDITPIWSRYAELYPLLVDRLARSGEVDAVVPVLLQRAATDEAAVRGVGDAVERLRADGVEVAVYVCWVTSRAERDRAAVLQEAGVPCFDWPERTARAVGHAVRYGRSRGTVRTPVPAPPRPEGMPDLRDGVLDARTGAGLLAAAGVPVVDTETCDTAAAAGAAADRLGYPVVAKVDHPDLVHKTDAGGVRVGLRDQAAVGAAAEELLGLRAGAQVLVQPQSDGLELVVGGLRDPQFGAVVMVGLGGVHVEALGDVAFGLAPLDLPTARDLVLGLRGAAVLTGARAGTGVDVDAVAGLVRAVGDLLAHAPEVAELDLNPVLATRSGVLAVDWRVRVEFSPGRDKSTAAD